MHNCEFNTQDNLRKDYFFTAHFIQMIAIQNIAEQNIVGYVFL